MCVCDYIYLAAVVVRWETDTSMCVAYVSIVLPEGRGVREGREGESRRGMEGGTISTVSGETCTSTCVAYVSIVLPEGRGVGREGREGDGGEWRVVLYLS